MKKRFRVTMEITVEAQHDDTPENVATIIVEQTWKRICHYRGRQLLEVRVTGVEDRTRV